VWAADDVFQLTGLSETILFENMKVFYSEGFCTNIRNLLQILFGEKALGQILSESRFLKRILAKSFITVRPKIVCGKLFFGRK
jgi:hypothetical protein